ncbi:sulfotransferase family protein [Thermococcus gorgonarius]|nr:sulfotransferase [Thermococcus gorgonarius]
MVEQIFIGGTGRSGTTILGRILSYHKDIFVFPFETRFIVDPDGLITLALSLSEYWDQYKSDLAIKRFRQLMSKLYPSSVNYKLRLGLYLILPKLHISPPEYTYAMARQWRGEEFFSYARAPFSPFISRTEYFRRLDEFINTLIVREFEGFWLGTPSFRFRPRIYVTKRFKRDEIFRISRNYVNSLFQPILRKYNKKIWADHTPTNILHASLLCEMFPDCKIIHIHRDLRDVVASYLTKHWGGNTVEDATHTIKFILEKWEEEKQKLDTDKYLEISLEELVQNKEKTLSKLSEFLNIEFDENMLKVDLSRSNLGRWKRDLTDEEAKFVERTLNEFMELYGYL